MSGRISIDPEVNGGKPTVTGTRVSVQTVLGHLSAGDSVEDVLDAYPRLTREDVLACLEYAVELCGRPDPRYTLAELLDRMTLDNLPDDAELGWGPPVGLE